MLDLEQITEAATLVAHEFSIKSIMLFGSYAEGRNTKSSDIDLLIEFDTPYVSLITLSAVKNRLEELLGVPVDVIHAPLPDGAIIDIGRTVSLYAA